MSLNTLPCVTTGFVYPVYTPSHFPHPEQSHLFGSVYQPSGNLVTDRETAVLGGVAPLLIGPSLIPNPLVPSFSNYIGDTKSYSLHDETKLSAQLWAPNKLLFEKSIGYGAFGVVWSVVDPRNGQRVALKRIQDIFDNLASARRAYRELFLLLNLQHVNVIRLLDIVKVDFSNFDDISILCEYMDTDLHKIIVSCHHISMEHVKIFMYQLLRGLKYLHSAGIIHRDLKPGNLLVNANCLLKICDFGLARSVTSECEHEQEDLLTVEVVTQFYRSPELLLGSTYYTSAVDMWSVGCILAELLTRRILFQSTNCFRHLDLILDLIGTPTSSDLNDLVGVPTLSLEFLFSRSFRPVNHAAFLTLVTPAVLHPSPATYLHDPPDTDLRCLLMGFLTFNPSKRLTAGSALKSPFLQSGRSRFHSCLCSCCPRTDISFPNTYHTVIPVYTHTFQPFNPYSYASRNSAGTQSSSPCTPTSPFTPPAFSTLYSISTEVVPHLLPSNFSVPPPLSIPPEELDLEPVFISPNRQHGLNTEADFSNLLEAKTTLWNLIESYFNHDFCRARVVINNFSPNFGRFTTS